MTQPTRVGLIVPSSNTTMETELPAILARRRDAAFTIHSARARMKHVTPEELAAMNGQTARAATELSDMRPAVVATACLVAIMAQGPGYHTQVEADITRVLRENGSDAPVVTSAGALVAALDAIGARRIAMVTPYMPPLTRLVADYIEESGIEVNDALSLCVPDNVAVAALDPQDLLAHHRRLDLSSCDALVISACVQMPSLPVVEQVARETGLPTLSASMATAWSILQAIGYARCPKPTQLLAEGQRTAA